MQPSFIATGTKLIEKDWKFCMVCQKLNVNQMHTCIEHCQTNVHIVKAM